MTLPSSPLGRALGLLAVLFLAVFLGYPLAAILLRSVVGGSPGDLLTTPYYLGRIGFTLFQALLSTALTVAVGVPGALLFARYAFRGKRLLRSAFTIPFVMPTVVAAIGFLALVGPRGLLGVDLRGTLAIVLFAHVFYNYAVVVRIVGGYLEAAAPRLTEAAATLGAGPWRALWRVTLPLAAPAILAAATLVFVFTFTSFGVILILAPGLATLEVEIYRLTARLLRLDAAALLALIQLVVIMAVSWIYTRLQERLAVPLGGAPRRLPKPRGWGRLLLGANLLIAATLILSPLVALAWQSVWPPGAEGASLAGFRALLAPSTTLGVTSAARAVVNSLLFAGSSTALALLVGFTFSYAVARGGWRVLDGASLLPLATSAVTLGFGYLLVFQSLTVSRWGLTLAHALIAFPFVTRALLPAMRGTPRATLDAARTLGAGAGSLLRRVELPLLTPSLVTAASFAFAISMGEFGATLVIRRPEFATLPIAIFERLGRPGAANYASALALAVLLMALTGLVMLLFERFGEAEF